MSNDLTRRPPDSPEPASEAQLPATQGPVPERHVFTPQIDIFETAEGLVLRADLPGVSLETLDLQVQNNRLTLFGRVPEVAGAEATLVQGDPSGAKTQVVKKVNEDVGKKLANFVAKTVNQAASGRFDVVVALLAVVGVVAILALALKATRAALSLKSDTSRDQSLTCS